MYALQKFLERQTPYVRPSHAFNKGFKSSIILQEDFLTLVKKIFSTDLETFGLNEEKFQLLLTFCSKSISRRTLPSDSVIFAIISAMLLNHGFNQANQTLVNITKVTFFPIAGTTPFDIARREYLLKILLTIPHMINLFNKLDIFFAFIGNRFSQVSEDQYQFLMKNFITLVFTAIAGEREILELVFEKYIDVFSQWLIEDNNVSFEIFYGRLETLLCEQRKLLSKQQKLLSEQRRLQDVPICNLHTAPTTILKFVLKENLTQELAKICTHSFSYQLKDRRRTSLLEKLSQNISDTDAHDFTMLIFTLFQHQAQQLHYLPSKKLNPLINSLRSWSSIEQQRLRSSLNNFGTTQNFTTVIPLFSLWPELRTNEACANKIIKLSPNHLSDLIASHMRNVHAIWTTNQSDYTERQQNFFMRFLSTILDIYIQWIDKNSSSNNRFGFEYGAQQQFKKSLCLFTSYGQYDPGQWYILLEYFKTKGNFNDADALLNYLYENPPADSMAATLELAINDYDTRQLAKFAAEVRQRTAVQKANQTHWAPTHWHHNGNGVDRDGNGTHHENANTNGKYHRHSRKNSL